MEERNHLVYGRAQVLNSFAHGISNFLKNVSYFILLLLLLIEHFVSEVLNCMDFFFSCSILSIQWVVWVSTELYCAIDFFTSFSQYALFLLFKVSPYFAFPFFIYSYIKSDFHMEHLSVLTNILSYTVSPKDNKSSI